MPKGLQGQKSPLRLRLALGATILGGLAFNLFRETVYADALLVSAFLLGMWNIHAQSPNGQKHE
jgi:hypothetical protein